jgi:hypothetical protein
MEFTGLCLPVLSDGFTRDLSLQFPAVDYSVLLAYFVCKLIYAVTYEFAVQALSTSRCRY